MEHIKLNGIRRNTSYQRRLPTTNFISYVECPPSPGMMSQIV